MGGLKGNVNLRVSIETTSGGDSSPGTPRTPGGTAFPCTPGGTAIGDKFEAIKRREKAKLQKIEREKEDKKRIDDEKQAVLDAKRARKEAAADKKVDLMPPSAVTGSNRTSASAAMRTLSAQLRTNLKRNQKVVALKKAEIQVLQGEDDGTDVSGSQKLKIEELEIEIAKYPISVAAMYAALDTDGNGYLDRDEFLTGLLAMKCALNREELALLWTMFDSNGDGRLDYWEFEPIITKDDAANATDPTTRKGSQLALRRPSMIRTLHNHTKAARKQRITQSTLKLPQLRPAAKSQQVAAFVKPNKARTNKQFVLRQKSTAYEPKPSRPLTYRATKPGRPNTSPVEMYMSPRCKRLVQKRGRYLRGEPLFGSKAKRKL